MTTLPEHQSVDDCRRSLLLPRLKCYFLILHGSVYKHINGSETHTGTVRCRIRIHFLLMLCKNYQNRSSSAKVIAKCFLQPFYGPQCIQKQMDLLTFLALTCCKAFIHFYKQNKMANTKVPNTKLSWISKQNIQFTNCH